MKLIAASPILALAVIALTSCVGAPPRTASVDPAGPEGIRCRETLVAGSNQHRRLCGTEEQWAHYERRLASASEALTLRLQGSRFGGSGY